MRTDFWSKERIATLERLWAQGKSAGIIAKALGGISRSAVLGKIFRLRLGDAKASAQASAKAPEQEARKQQGKLRLARRRGIPSAAAPPSRAPRRKTLFELTNQCCRWPHGQPGSKNFFFCGAPGADVEGGVPYCAAHMKRAYIVPPDNAGKTRAGTGLATSLTPWRIVSSAA
jgi:GcrA cell cycle regulator